MTNNIARLAMHSNDPTEMLEYLLVRARQVLSIGYVLDRIAYSSEPYGHASAFFKKDGQYFKSVYIAAEARGRGAYQEWHQRTDPSIPVLTVADCGIAGYLGFNDIKHIVVTGEFDSTAYKLIQAYYADRKPKRANVWLMNHIDEGLAILNKLGADQAAYETFCLHALIQNDNDLRTNHHLVSEYHDISWAGAFEYRSVANEYLSNRVIESIDEIRLSPLTYVNQALIADKIQNYKDFMMHHHGEHPRSNELFNYFHNWFDALALSNKFIVDSLIMLYDNDDMNAVNKNVSVHRIPLILTQTNIERERRNFLLV